MSEVHRCPHCGSQSSIYYHRISPGIVHALIKFRQACAANHTYSIHNRKDMDGTAYELTKTEAANFTMLRYHGLVAKDKARGAGYWILTTRGRQFLDGIISLPNRVKVLNNRVQHDWYDDEYVTVTDVLKERPPAFDPIERIEREPVKLDVRPHQESLFA